MGACGLCLHTSEQGSLADSYEFGNKHAGNFFDKLNTQKKQMW